MDNNPQFLAGEWDWRPLARLVAWCLVLAAAVWLGFLPARTIVRCARELILLWLLTFGVLTRLLLILVVGAFRLAAALESLAFRISDWLVEIAFDPGPRALRFASALGVEFMLVTLAALMWNFRDLGTRLAFMAGGAR